MSFTAIDHTRRVSNTGVSAAVRAVGRGQSTIRVDLHLSLSIVSTITHKKYDVLAGENEDYGQILVIFGASGKRSLIAKRRGGTYVRFPPVPCVPDGYTFAAEPCAWKWKKPGAEMLVTLPVSAWEKKIPEPREDE